MVYLPPTFVTHTFAHFPPPKVFPSLKTINNTDIVVRFANKEHRQSPNPPVVSLNIDGGVWDIYYDAKNNRLMARPLDPNDFKEYEGIPIDSNSLQAIRDRLVALAETKKTDGQKLIYNGTARNIQKLIELYQSEKQ